MLCPKCGQQFELYVTVCPSCDLDLVDRIPGPEPTPDVALARVLVTGDAGLIPLAKSLLEGEGIEYLIRGEGLQDLFGWGRVGSGYNYIVGPAEFWVRADQAERARELLKGLDAQSYADTEPPHDA
jgi:Putative prokaryotic signal transducing protein